MLSVGRRECAFVSTGSIIPEGADAVVMMEYSKKSGNQVEFIKSVAKGENVTYRGSDIKRGTIVLQARHILVSSGFGHPICSWNW